MNDIIYIQSDDYLFQLPNNKYVDYWILIRDNQIYYLKLENNKFFKIIKYI